MSENPDLSILSSSVDKSQVPPIDQKRMVAFINEFIISTVTFLNEFMTNVETKFVEFEFKMQKIEASLLIVEAKMASIPDVQTNSPTNNKSESPQQKETTAKEAVETESQITTEATQDQPSTTNVHESEPQDESGQDAESSTSGVKASEDSRYRKYFKMLQFGVPPPAVKLKIANEGFDPNILDDPNRILEDGVLFVATDD